MSLNSYFVAARTPSASSLLDGERARASYSGLRAAAATVDVSMVFFATLITVAMVPQSAFVTRALPAILVALTWVSILVGIEVRNRREVDSFARILPVLKSALLTLAAFAVISFLAGSAAFRTQTLLVLALGVPLVVVGRLALRAYAQAQWARGSGTVRTLVVGSGTQAVSDRVGKEPSLAGGYQIVGTTDTMLARNPANTVTAVADRAIALNANVILVRDIAALGNDGLRRLAWELESEGIDILVDPGVEGFARNRTSLAVVGNDSVIRIGHGHRSMFTASIKRLLDIAVSAIGLVLVAPLIAVVALAIRLESPGSAFFVQPRVGKGGELFPFFKLRSMRANAHLERADVLGPTDEGIVERYLNDDRITRVGSFIRRWSIDELPQLLNVFMGHMSLVGPRPVLVEELHDLPVDGHRVHLAKPGLTGLWQVSGRKEIHWEDRIDLDLEYVDTKSLGVDVKILTKTAGAIVKGSGAY